MAGLLFEDFLRNLQTFVGVTERTAPELKALLSSVNTEIKVFDDVMKGITRVEARDGLLFIGEGDGILVNELEQLIKSADLLELVSRLNAQVIVTPLEIDAFRTIVGFTPQRVLRDLERLININRTVYNRLDATVETFDQLSQTAKDEIVRIEKYLINWKGGVVLLLTLGAMTVTAGWVLRETRRRAGCHMLTTINGKTTSCKIMNYSCTKTDGMECKPPAKLYNTTLEMIAIAQLSNDDTRKIEAAKHFDVPVDMLENRLGELIDTKFADVSNYIKSLKLLPTFDVCTPKNPNIESGIIPFCRMCNPMADPKSTQYIDSSMYATNVTFKCVVNPSIIDVITDAAQASGLKLFDSIKSFVGNIKYMIYIAVGIILVVIVINIVLFAIKWNKKNQQTAVITPNIEKQLPNAQSNVSYIRII